MPCVLHFTGDQANVAELERLSPIELCAVFRKGEPRSNRPAARLSRTSGVSLVASDADFDYLEQQQLEALAFLQLHMVKLQAMRAVSGVELASIDFGISMRNVIAQTDVFEPDLLAEIASLRLQMALSQYPTYGKSKKVKQYRRVLRSAA
jgi:hypothetical protein